MKKSKSKSKSKLQFKILNFSLSFCILIFAFYTFAHAAPSRLYFVPESQTVPVGGQAVIDLMLDAGGEDINALEGTIRYTKENLSIESVGDGSSIIRFWMKKPIPDYGTISFSGIMPNGFSGVYYPGQPSLVPGRVLSLVARPTKEGEAHLTIENIRLVKNDGRGTALTYTVGEAEILIAGATTSLTEKGDDDPPESFTPQVVVDKNLYKGVPTLIFSTSDKGSGINHYEISTRGGDFKREESPYPLYDVAEGAIIVVRAIDNAGNLREASVVWGTEKESQFRVYAILSTAVLLSIILAWFIRSRKYRV